MKSYQHTHIAAAIILLIAFTSLLPAGEPKREDLLSNESALEKFVDGIVTNRMREAHVPGAVVTIVKGDRVIFSKGYGFANLEQRTPVDPDKTLFRIASVSKVFNAMAVMRLVDEGLVDVNEDVRPRLAAAGLELDNQVLGPITMKDLLTHTAGIRDLWIPNVTGSTNAGQVLSLESYLKKCLPLRWQAPEESVLYTDHGIALAGYVVELASKTNYENAVTQRVMRPLGMNHTWYTMALPEKQRTNLAVAYSYRDTDYKPIPFFYISIEPPIGVLTTGNDMARLMICHLSNCKGFLKPQTTALMQQPQYADDARLGFQLTCGFDYESYPRQKEPCLFHPGGIYGFRSELGISLERGIGVFVAQNLSESPVFGLTDILNILSNNVATTAIAKPAQLSVATNAKMADVKSLAGTYVLDRTLSRGVKLSEQDYVNIRYVEDIKGIEVKYWQNRDNPMRYVQVAPNLFKSVDSDDQIAFRTSKDGKRTYLIDYYMRGDGAFRRISSSGEPKADF
ncbi:MAG TPA: serine hydrolase domain-containing protein [Verrucomicrobiae bacterium]|nr:serine hydrolase domain-containing protein [Verrucomicrobiae bacterium]